MVTSYTVALFCHILGVLLFVSGVVLAGVPFELARRRSDPLGISLLLALTRVGALLVAAGTIIVLAFGLWLVHLGGFGLGTGWILAALVLFGAALVLGALGGQRPKRARLHATRLAADGAPLDDELRELLDDGLSRTVNYASAIAVVAILALMVFKP